MPSDDRATAVSVDAGTKVCHALSNDTVLEAGKTVGVV